MTAGGPHVARARMAVRDLASEAVAGIFARPGRTVLTILGTVLGIGALVATLGIANTAGNRRYILGGGWTDEEYGFTDAYAQDPLDRSPVNGTKSPI